MENNWINVEDRLPKIINKFNESDYLLCCDDNSLSTPFVGWYNSNEKSWYVAHHSAPTIPTKVDYWMMLPKHPNQ